MGLKDCETLHLTTMSESSKWHARLGHINMESMKAMITKDLVEGVPSLVFNKEVCRFTWKADKESFSSSHEVSSRQEPSAHSWRPLRSHNIELTSWK